MGRNCTVCVHHARADIDAALDTERPLREIAAQYDISKTALHRHWHRHVFGASSPHRVASNTGTRAKVMGRSRAKTIAKWVLVTGLGLGILVWASRILGRLANVSISPPGT